MCTIQRYFKCLIIFSIAYFFSIRLCHSQEKRFLLTKNYSVGQLSEWLSEPKEWSPYPRYGSDWNNLPENVKAALVAIAEANIKKAIPQITASSILTYYKSNFGEKWHEKRDRLSQAVVAECIERKGRFMNEIADLIWSICEETFWVIPPHYSHYAPNGLPGFDVEYVDLHAAETGGLLAWTYYLLEEELDKVSPELNKRILHEIDKRILKPNYGHNDFNWIGAQGQPVGNWTTWISSNWLACVLICERDPEQRAQTVYKIMTCLDRFLNQYPADGGCEEGPGYWGVAGASLFTCLELLDLATRGKIKLWDVPLIRNIGQYIYKVHIQNDYYINFADADVITQPNSALVFRFGKKINDKTMMAFGSWLANRQKIYDGGINDFIIRNLASFQTLPELKKIIPREPLVGQSWFPELQVLSYHSGDSNGKGFFLGAKGGHNGESGHNHNDVGSFIIYYDGEPIIIDAGVEDYREKTFSSERYSIWTMQSQYHNLPTINGTLQAPGKEFKAQNTTCEFSNNQVKFCLDISMAYPKSAGIEKWNRTLIYNTKRQEIKLFDEYQLLKVTESCVINFMTCCLPVINEKNYTVTFKDIKNTQTQIELRYPKNFNARFEKIIINGSGLREVWGEKNIYRIQFIDKIAKNTGSYGFTFIRQK